MKQLPLQHGSGRYRVPLYTLVLLMLIAVGGEIVSRTVLIRQAMGVDPLESANYAPVSAQFEQIRQYATRFGNPNCIFFGSSLVRTGINPDIFERAYQATTGEGLSCYNFGIDGASLSSVSALTVIVARTYRPKLVIVGLQAGSWLAPNDPTAITEQRFRANNWIRYNLGEFTVEGWLLEHSMLYRLVDHYVYRLFPIQHPSDIAPTISHPAVPGIVADNGYSPLVGYSDVSPLFQPVNAAQRVKPLDPEDLDQFYQLIETSQTEHIPVIVIDMPAPVHLGISDATLSAAKTYAREHGVPVLSLNAITILPATAFTDTLHMQGIGSFMFSDWLGSQIGHATIAGALSRPADAVWSPNLDKWSTQAYTATLGLSQSSYTQYVSAANHFNLVDPKAVIFNPSTTAFDRVFAQSLVGLAIDWQAKVTDQERANLFQFMVVLGKMRYQSDLELPPSTSASLDRWRATLDPYILTVLGIHYVLCRVELANPAIAHCPSGITTNPAYALVGVWNLTPLYERYSLYQVNPLGNIF